MIHKREIVARQMNDAFINPKRHRDNAKKRRRYEDRLIANQVRAGFDHAIDELSVFVLETQVIPVSRP